MEIGVREAAERLRVDESRVRQLLGQHELRGRQVGRTWLVSEDDLARRAARRSPPGRPMAPARAWGLLDLLAGHSAPWLPPVARSQVRAVGRRLRGADPDRWRAALRARNDVHRYQAHPAALRRLSADPVVRRGGATEAARLGIDLVDLGGRPEVYVPGPELARLVGSLHLLDVRDEPDVIVHVPRLWPFESREAVSLAALAADLLDSEEPRSVAAGAATLDALSAQAFA